MNSPQEQLAALADIRNMMERSSRFLSLSGLSGISAGIVALLGAGLAYWRMNPPNNSEIGVSPRLMATESTMLDLAIIAVAVLILALAFGIFFTTRNARRKQEPLWGALTKRLLISLLIPLVAGGIFCLSLMYHGVYGLVAPATLIFYGLALYNASKHTLHDIRYLGISQMALGLLASFYIGYGLLFWSIGFGVLHIFYGTAMYVKYES